MPKTPPLIIPNNIPNDWMSRSKINKSNNKVKNIFAAQNKKQLRFDESEELQFGDSFDPSSEIGLGDFHPQHNEQQIASSPPAASEVFYFTPLNQQNNPSQTSFKHSQHSQDQSKSVSQQQQKQQLYMQTDTPEQEKQHSMDIDQPKESQEQIVTQNNENFNTTLVDMSSEFQQYLEEHRQIKKSIEDKRKELEQFTKERLQYLDERQAYFQSRMKSLKEFY